EVRHGRSTSNRRRCVARCFSGHKDRVTPLLLTGLLPGRFAQRKLNRSETSEAVPRHPLQVLRASPKMRRGRTRIAPKRAPRGTDWRGCPVSRVPKTRNRTPLTRRTNVAREYTLERT